MASKEEQECRGRSPARRRLAAAANNRSLEAVGEEERHFESLSPRWMSLSGGLPEDPTRTLPWPLPQLPSRESVEEVYYSEPERDVHWSASSPDTPAPSLLHRPSCPLHLDQLARPPPAQVVPPLRGRAAATPRGAASSSPSVQRRSRANTIQERGPREETVSPKGRKPEALDFARWLRDEVQSRPDDSQLPKVPKSHLVEVVKVPHLLEKLLFMGFLLCLDILLHELSFTPLQVVCAVPKLLKEGVCMVVRWVCRCCCCCCCCCCRRKAAAEVRKPVLSVTEQGDIIRLTLLVINVALILVCFDVSWTYHYIRGESFLKLYVIFNMLEMFERWCRSVGVDLFDLIMASVRHPWYSLLVKYLATVVYCFVHSTMHLVRVLLLNVAINTSSSSVFMIIITNNFGEIKSTVFKRYEAKSLFPIITSDIVERFYLLADIIFVLCRIGISTHSGAHGGNTLAFWLFLLVGLEIGTDWIKFCLIMKFSDLSASVLEIYKEVLIADVLLCRSPLHAVQESVTPKEKASGPPNVPFRGIHSFSHCLQRRLGFSGVPMTSILVFHLVMLARAPCSVELQWPGPTLLLFAAGSFVLCLLAKVLLGVIILGFAARRRSKIPRGLELFPKIKSL